MKSKYLLPIALAGGLAAAAGCTPKTAQPTTASTQFMHRVAEYQNLREMEKKGEIKLDHAKYKDVKTYLTSGSLPKYVLEAKSTPRSVEQPASNDDWQVSIAPYIGMKFAHSAKDKPDNMPFYGLEAQAKKGRLAGYLGVDYGKMTEKKDGTESGMDWNATLNSEATTVRGGVLYYVKDGQVFSFALGAGPRLMHEQNDGEIEMATPTGTSRRDIHDSQNIFGFELGPRAQWNFHKNASLGARYEYGFNFDSENVDRDGKFILEFILKF